MSNIDTRITEVTVYPDRARVTRRGEVTVEPGSHRLEIVGLPLGLDTASVRAAARGTARARLLGVDVRRSFHVETPDEVVRQLEHDVEALQDRISLLQAEGERLGTERAALQGLQSATDVYARGLAFSRTTPADQMALFDRLQERAATLDEQRQSLSATLRDLERKLDKLQKELKQLRSARSKERYGAVVEVGVLEGGNLTLELTYVISRASWTPLYDMRLSADGAVLEAGYLAQVVQSTGEEWADVALTLSTARPALAGLLPKLEPWYVRPISPPPPPQARAMLSRAAAPEILGSGVPAAMEELVLAEAGPVYDAEAVVATVETAGAAVTYVLPARATVPPDGAPHKVTVARYPLAPHLDYVSAPKLAEAAYRRAKVANDSAYTLLPGLVNLFAGDEFIGGTKLELTAPGGEIELYLGVDDRVRVKRELKGREIDKKLLTDKRRLWYAYEIEVENLLGEVVKLTLHDQIPVPGHEEIKVRLETAEPKPTSESDLGLLEWSLTLAPQEKRIVRFGFVVEHPRTLTVIGLP